MPGLPISLHMGREGRMRSLCCVILLNADNADSLTSMLSAPAPDEQEQPTLAEIL